jgi:hypothetical protein
VIMSSISRFVKKSWRLIQLPNAVNLMLFLFQVVLANGDTVKTASRARKSAAGFVLLSLSIYY